jgi:hypothetical protein
MLDLLCQKMNTLWGALPKRNVGDEKKREPFPLAS